MVLSFLVGGLTLRNTNGNLILLLWNCLVLSLLQSLAGTVAVLMIWMQGNLTRCLDAISVYICSTAPFKVVSRYSLYMLWYPVLLWYLNQIPKFLMVVGFFSKICKHNSITDYYLSKLTIKLYKNRNNVKVYVSSSVID